MRAPGGIRQGIVGGVSSAKDAVPRGAGRGRPAGTWVVGRPVAALSNNTRTAEQAESACRHIEEDADC